MTQKATRGIQNNWTTWLVLAVAAIVAFVSLPATARPTRQPQLREGTGLYKHSLFHSRQANMNAGRHYGHVPKSERMNRRVIHLEVGSFDLGNLQSLARRIPADRLSVLNARGPRS